MKNEHTNSLFEYDRLINEDQFCNFKQEQLQLLKFINSGNCVKIYGHRNFGKTSLIKNIIGKKWQAANKTKRTVVYIDLYSVSSLEDISLEFTKAFQKAINSKKTLFDKGLDWLKMLKRVRPAWTISPDSDSLGNFVLPPSKMKPSFLLILLLKIFKFYKKKVN
jgi:AAA+ ATPase superfamily predicted ATPase